VGGLDLNPTVISCGYNKILFGFISMKTILVIVGVVLIIYYGWSMIEKALLYLPIPDPNTIKEKASSFFAKKGSLNSRSNASAKY